MKKALIVVILAAAAAAIYFAATNSGGSETLGKHVPANAQFTGIGDVLKQAKAEPAEVAVKGEITQKCPTSGCWFYIKDDSGSIRVDTQFSGFNVLNVPSGSKVAVHGKVAKPEDGEAEISVVGMRIER